MRYLYKNVITFLFWVAMLWMFFNTNGLLMMLAAMFLCAAPFYKLIVTEMNRERMPTMTGLTRYTLLHSTMALTIAKASVFQERPKVKSSHEVLVKDEEDET